MDLYDKTMLDFALRWAPYGGGDDHIFPEFGLSVPSFYVRVLDLIDRQVLVVEDEIRTDRLRAMCRSKLSMRRPSSIRMTRGAEGWF
ncbi:DUF3263 domain-containing protein [Rhodococcus sp. NPDC057014]|uniref:DUF3263 domain-containing protein n=1 Tax=Rhodococcus sp. NPDC057014 TaxID=3346000 RepID=UPI00363BEEC0